MTARRSAVAWTLSSLLAFGVAVAYIRNAPAAAVPTAGDSASVHLAQGLHLHAQGNVDGALREYQQAANLNPRLALAFYNLGVAHYQLRHVDEAIASYAQSIVLDPGNADAHFNLGYVLAHDRQDPSGALEQMKRAVEINPGLAKGYVEMGLAYDRLAVPDRARECYDQALKADPSLKAVVSKIAGPGSAPR